MLNLIARRLALGLLVAFTVMTLAFMLTRLSGDLAISIAGPQASQADVEIIRKAYGLDRPLFIQFFSWVGRAMIGDFGQSYFFKDSVANLIGRRLPITLTLGLVGLSLALIISIPLGILAALRENSWIDRAVTMFTMVGQAIPSFWLALILMIVLGLNLGILPISGTGTWQHFVMPGIVLAFTAIPALTRLTRSGMIEAMASDYIRARQGPVARAHRPEARVAQRRDPGGLDRRGPARLHAGRLHRHRDGVRAAWRRLSRLGKHRQERFPGGAGGGAGAGCDLYRPDVAGRHPQRAARSEAPDRMSEPIAIHAPLTSRVGVAGFTIGIAIVAVIVVVALVGNQLIPQDPFTQDLGNRLKPPFWMEGTQPGHLLGTDQLGRDYLARLAYGARISLLIGIMTVITSGLIGITLGVLGGFFGGRIDDAVLFAITTRLSIPVVLVALAVVGLMGSGLGLVVATLGLLLWDRFAVVARATTMQIRNLDYVNAARCAGASTPHLLVKEILPNIASHLAVVATLEMALAILLEAALSFLGLGVPPPLPSWGLMIAEGKDYMFFSPWVIMVPGVALFVLVLGINLVGDGLRNLLGGERSR
jgi:peptide/nickel transport system permease protein